MDLSNNIWRNIPDLSNNIWRNIPDLSNNIVDLSNNFFGNINENLFLSPMMTNINRLFPQSFPTTGYDISSPIDISSNRTTFLDTLSKSF